MSTAEAIVIVLAVAVGTFVMRAGLVLALSDRPVPVVVERALRFVGPAVLAALTVNLAVGDGAGGVDFDVAEAAALAMAGVVAWRRRPLLVSLLAGMTTLWIVDALVG